MVAMLSPFQNLQWTSICFFCIFLFNDSSNKRTKDSLFTLSVSLCKKYSPRWNVDRYLTFVSEQLKFCAITLSGNIRLNKCGISAEEWNEKFESINFEAHRISAVVTSFSLMNKDLQLLVDLVTIPLVAASVSESIVPVFPVLLFFKFVGLKVIKTK